MFATSQHSIHTILLSVHMGEGEWVADFLSNSITFPDLERFGPHLLSFQFNILKKKKKKKLLCTAIISLHCNA